MRARATILIWLTIQLPKYSCIVLKRFFRSQLQMKVETHNSNNLREVCVKIENDVSLAETYEGPIGIMETVDTIFHRPDLGIDIMVGKSVVSPGRGLFLRISSEFESVILPRGTRMCSYSRGRFCKDVEGDKSVAFIFPDPSFAVMHNDELISLKNVIGLVAENSSDLTNALSGHKFGYDPDNVELTIEPCMDAENYFIPFENEPIDIHEDMFGMFANDLAYEDGVDEDTYYSNSARNVLKIVWRVEADTSANVIRPVHPVLLLSETLKFTQKEPVEIGVTYSWMFWASRRQILQKDSK